MLIERVDYSRITRDLTPDWREERHIETPGGISPAGGWAHRASFQSGASEDQPSCGLSLEVREGHHPVYLVPLWAQMHSNDPQEGPEEQRLCNLRRKSATS